MLSQTPGQPGPDNLPRALAWMIFSGLSFALMGASVKLAGDVPLAAKVFFRNLVTLLITAGIAWRQSSNPLARTGHRWRLFWRACCGLGGVSLYFLALNDLNLADASLLNKTSPFFVAFFAGLWLKEPLGRSLIGALVVALAGAALVIKPSFDYAVLPAVAGLGSGLFSGMAYTIVRSLKGKESPNRIIFVFSLVSTLATGPFLILEPPSPDTVQWLALVGCGISAAGGQFGLTFAYHHAPASRVSIFTYLHVLFALIIGMLFWAEIPDLLSWAGGLLIVAAAVHVHRTGTRQGRITAT